VEARILREAVAQVEALPPERRARHAYAVAGADWHEGVIGIVASRLVERYTAPVVLIAGTEGDWKGSGRSIPAFDLHGALGACSDLLERWGGHRAAAGSRSPEENVEAFAEAFAEHGRTRARRGDLEPVTSIDAVVARGATSRSSSARARQACAVRARQPARDAARSRLRARRARDRSATGSICAFRVRRDGRDAGSAIAFGQGSRSRCYGRTRSTTSRSGWRRTTGTARSRRSSSSADLRRAPRYRGAARLARGRVEEARGARDREAKRSSPSSAIVEGGLDATCSSRTLSVSCFAERPLAQRRDPAERAAMDAIRASRPRLRRDDEARIVDDSRERCTSRSSRSSLRRGRDRRPRHVSRALRAGGDLSAARPIGVAPERQGSGSAALCPSCARRARAARDVLRVLDGQTRVLRALRLRPGRAARARCRPRRPSTALPGRGARSTARCRRAVVCNAAFG
jgi:hypothetical protein